MANPKFLGVDLSGANFSWSAGENTAKPLSNLYTYYNDQVSGSNGDAAGQTLNFERVSTLPIATLLIIDGANFAALGTTSIKLQHDTTGAGAWADVIANIPALSTVQAIAVPFYIPGSNLWRFQFNKGSNLSAAPEVGNIFFGTSLDFLSTQQWKYFTDMPDFEDDAVRALDGRLDTSEIYGISKHNCEFKLHTDAFVVLWRAFLRTVKGRARPFYYIDNNSAVWLVNFEKSFNPYEAFRYNQNDIARFTLVSTMGE